MMRIGAALTAFLVGAALYSVAVAPVFAYELVKSSNGAVFSRSDEDTTQATITQYWNYKGGNNWTGTYPFGLVSSFNSSTVLATWYTSGQTVEFPFVDGYRLQAFYIQDGVKSKMFSLINEPIKVAQSAPVTIGAPVAVSSMPTVSVGSSLSISGTLPVDLVSVDGESSYGLWVFVGLCSLTGGLYLFKGVYRDR